MSHNSFGVFFSGTDTSTLLEQAFVHNFFVSLIINNKLDKIAKISFAGTREVVQTYYNRIGNVNLRFNRTEKEDVVYVVDVAIQYEGFEEDEELNTQITWCEEQNAAKKKAVAIQPAWQSQLNLHQDQYPDYGRQQLPIFSDGWDLDPKKDWNDDSDLTKVETSKATFKEKCENLVKRILVCDYTGELTQGMTIHGAKIQHKEDYEETPLHVYIQEVDDLVGTLLNKIFQKELEANYDDDVNFKKLRDMISSQCRITLENTELENQIFECIDQELKLMDNERNEDKRNSRAL